MEIIIIHYHLNILFIKFYYKMFSQGVFKTLYIFENYC